VEEKKNIKSHCPEAQTSAGNTLSRIRVSIEIVGSRSFNTNGNSKLNNQRHHSHSSPSNWKNRGAYGIHPCRDKFEKEDSGQVKMLSGSVTAIVANANDRHKLTGKKDKISGSRRKSS
jgi:hypothetical protein